jgi:hypothetical protein
MRTTICGTCRTRKHPNLMGERRHDFFIGNDTALRRCLPADYLRDAAGHKMLWPARIRSAAASPHGTGGHDRRRLKPF